MSPLISHLILWGSLSLVLGVAVWWDRRIERHNIDRRWQEEIQAWYRGDLDELVINARRRDAEGEAFQGGDVA